MALPGESDAGALQLAIDGLSLAIHALREMIAMNGAGPVLLELESVTRRLRSDHDPQLDLGAAALLEFLEAELDGASYSELREIAVRRSGGRIDHELAKLVAMGRPAVDPRDFQVEPRWPYDDVPL